MAEVRWGVLGTGSIAGTVIAANPGGFIAIASRDGVKAVVAAAALGLG
jgi:predicted dehydrogenase